MRISIKIILACALLAGGGLFALGREQVWVMLGGPPDLGPVDFATLKPPSSPNHFLVCPEVICLRTTPDMKSPIYPVGAGELQRLVQQAWSTEPRLQHVASNPQAHRDRYVQRTAIMGFPDSISVHFIDLGPGKASLAIYSRSQIGYYYLGVNKARVLRWLSLLRAKVDSERS